MCNVLTGMTKMTNKFFKTHGVKLLNIGVVFYFLGLYTLYLAKLQGVVLGVFIELITVPFFLAQLILLVINVKRMMTYTLHVIEYLSFALLLICTCITIYSFMV